MNATLQAAHPTRVAELEDRWSQEQLITGVRAGQWLAMLSRLGWPVSREYLHRAAWIGLLGLSQSLLAPVERLVYGRAVREQPLSPAPIFGLGHWRSGTTHLHNLLGRDPAHAYTTVWQVVFPETMLLTGRLGPRLLASSLPAKRSYDNMAHGWHEPAEDEIALLKLTGGRSFYTAAMFPDLAEAWARYIDFAEASEEDRQIFVDALQAFVRKCMVANGGRRIIVKSCLHSARIPLLLRAFPEARFVHVHRHPARVFQSMLHMRAKVDWENFLHRPTREFVGLREEHTLRAGERLFTRLLEDRALIEPDRIVEIAYDDLCGHELEVTRAVYERFGMDFQSYEPHLRSYLDRIAGYQRNRFQIDDRTLDLVYERWRPVYEAYGYEREFTGL